MYRVEGKIDPVEKSYFLFHLFSFSNFLSFMLLHRALVFGGGGDWFCCSILSKKLELVRLNGQE